MKTRLKLLILFLIIFMATSIVLTLNVVAINEELTTVQNKLTTTKEELATTQENYQAEIEKSIGLNESLEKANAELEVANATLDALKNDEYKLVYIGDYTLTHYCVEKIPHICGTGTGLTATGTQVDAGRTIAVDPSVIPYGTTVYIEGYGFRIAEDCGGGVNGKHIDVAVDTHSQALNMGSKIGGVWVLVKRN